MLPPKCSCGNSLFVSPAHSGGSLLAPLQMPAPQARNHSPCITGFLILSFPKPLLLHTQSQSLKSCFPAPPAITSEKEHRLLTFSILNVHNPFSLLSEPIPLPHPQWKALIPALVKCSSDGCRTDTGAKTCHLTQDQLSMCELMLAQP